jgi:hypothetical protein
VNAIPACMHTAQQHHTVHTCILVRFETYIFSVPCPLCVVLCCVVLCFILCVLCCCVRHLRCAGVSVGHCHARELEATTGRDRHGMGQQRYVHNSDSDSEIWVSYQNLSICESPSQAVKHLTSTTGILNISFPKFSLFWTFKLSNPCRLHDHATLTTGILAILFFCNYACFCFHSKFGIWLALSQASSTTSSTLTLP